MSTQHHRRRRHTTRNTLPPPLLPATAYPSPRQRTRPHTATCASQSILLSPPSPHASHPATPRSDSLTHYCYYQPPESHPYLTRRDSRTLGPRSRRTLIRLLQYNRVSSLAFPLPTLRPPECGVVLLLLLATVIAVAHIETLRLTSATHPTHHPPSPSDITGQPHFHTSLQLYCACRTQHSQPTLQQWPKC